MLGVRVSVPIACFRKGLAREYLETEPIPPPSTCYGFLLSLVGETSRDRHIGARVTASLINKPAMSVVLRTVWRVKSKPLGSAGNSRPDYQQLLSDIQLIIWVDSSDEKNDGASLEDRVRSIVVDKIYSNVPRFGGLSLGESTHLVNDVSPFHPEQLEKGATFLETGTGRMTLPVWVDHVGSAGTHYCTGDLISGLIVPNDPQKVPRIGPRIPSEHS